MEDMVGSCAAVAVLTPAMLLSFTSWLLILLVTASIPITKSVELVRITTTDGGFTLAKAGVFGVCYPGGSYEFMNTTVSAVGGCTSHSLGYKLDSSVLGGAALNITDALSQGLSTALVLNPISCAFAGLSFLLVLCGCMTGTLLLAGSSLVPVQCASLIGWGAWGVNLAMPLVTRHRISRSGMDNIFEVHIGNGVWLSLAALILYTVASCAASCAGIGLASMG